MSEHYDEIAIKARFWVSEIVDARLSDAFGGDERHAAAVVLAQLVGDVPGGTGWDSDEASCRLMLAALKLGQGELPRLALWASAAKEDPRDLIAAAEYARELRQEGEKEREADLGEYLQWVSGGTFFDEAE
ncbi:MAG TPA: hypothetical protein VFG89_02495 [Coriobacteriia bacterium]|nr:hypothetical protein [Coriobacteriia bacterium]